MATTTPCACDSSDLGDGACAVLATQKVADSLGLPAGHTLVVPFDLCAPYEELEKAAAAADAAFGGAGIDYLVHNAGARCPLHACMHVGCMGHAVSRATP